MAKLSFAALVIASVLPALGEGRPDVFIPPFCGDGLLDKGTIDNGILNPINARREKLAKGTQQNGLTGKNLPRAVNMTQLSWNCQLEQKAINALQYSCVNPDNPIPPTNNEGLANVFSAQFEGANTGATTEEIFKDFLNLYLRRIDVKELSVVDSNPIYSGNDNLLQGYANLARATNTEIGCTVNRCPDYNPRRVTFYCLMNGKNIKDGEPIYQGTTKHETTCSDIICPAGYTYADRMTDHIRHEYELFRSLLANGQIPRKDGKYLPMAANMWKISYDCALEDGAIKYASQCPTTHSEPSSRPNIGENFKTFPATRFTFDTAPKKSVTEWWKKIRDVNYWSGNSVIFRPFHEQEPISSFTQAGDMLIKTSLQLTSVVVFVVVRMGWATSNKVGCSIVKCRNDNRYVGVCRYSPRGNIVNSNVYEVGRPCTRQPTGATSCDTTEGLWFK
ncbi:SCP-like protein [Ancylostoma caninum]|uniref:SCP-like protein n=1 Tax=Ancylostoma caninum TaxID=29170 RepID=A0A368HB16_ANCCA|nr:SCP-like protein [Ancylostoma caninum]